MSLTWNTKALKQQILTDLAENGEIVGKYVEVEARKKLLAITDPEWGAAYRSKLVARLLDFTVEKKQNEVVITVGILKGPEGTHHGFYIEMGSKTAPAHPYLRPAVFQNGKEIVSLLSGK